MTTAYQLAIARMSFDARMAARKARRESPEFKARIEAIASRRRHRRGIGHAAQRAGF